MTPFEHALRDLRQKQNSLVCLGLDPHLPKLPEWARKDVIGFTCDIIDAAAPYISCVKPNLKFYLTLGDSVLRQVIQHAASYGLPIILDDKAGDIGNTCEAYLDYIRSFQRYTKAIAFTANPYMGSRALEPFLEADDLMAIYIVKTSNPGSGEFQDLPQEDGMKLWERIATNIAQTWNKHSNCALVVGATYPAEIVRARTIVGEAMPILIPGFGKQGGEIEGSVRGGGENTMLNAARSIMLASEKQEDYQSAAAKAAQAFQQETNAFRQ